MSRNGILYGRSMPPQVQIDESSGKKNAIFNLDCLGRMRCSIFQRENLYMGMACRQVASVVFVRVFIDNCSDACGT